MIVGQVSHSQGLQLTLRMTANTPSSPFSTFRSPIWPLRGEQPAHIGWAGASQGQEEAMFRARNTGTGGSISQDGSKAFIHSFIHSFILNQATFLNDLLTKPGG